MDHDLKFDYKIKIVVVRDAMIFTSA